jgi:Lon protease-like protein
MMDNDIDLRDFDNVTRLFPLPGLVMFPHVILPLHIFEPRYCQMTEDALGGDRLITMIQIRPMPKGGAWTEPVEIETVGCLGRIIQHEGLPDGRFKILLLGRKRVRIRREIKSGKLYRTAEVEILDDRASLVPEEVAREELVGLFRKVLERQHRLDTDVAELLEKPVPLGILSDIMSHALSLPPALKQRLLDEPSVDARIDTLLTILRKVTAAEQPGRVFPPPFSPN